MERLAILDHSNHRLYVEDVSEESLEKYNGEEQAYIEDNYTFEGDYSWDYITDTEYIPMDDPTPMEVEFTDLL